MCVFFVLGSWSSVLDTAGRWLGYDWDYGLVYWRLYLVCGVEEGGEYCSLVLLVNSAMLMCGFFNSLSSV